MVNKECMYSAQVQWAQKEVEIWLKHKLFK